MEENNHEQLEKILQSVSQDAKPDKNFEQMLKVKLRERFHTKYEAQSQQISFFKRISRFKMQFASALMVVLFSSTTIYAYNSDTVTNGNILYPLKRSTENVEGLLATTPQAKTSYYNKMAKRRMRELAVLQTKGIKDEETIKETDTLLSKASLVARDVPDEEAESESTQTVSLQRVAPIKPLIQDAAQINLTEVVETPHKKTKREKALEEISQLREEFETKFEKREEKQSKLEIQTPIEIQNKIENKPIIEAKLPITKTEKAVEVENKLSREQRKTLNQIERKSLEKSDSSR